jgi:hypothetical protein
MQIPHGREAKLRLLYGPWDVAQRQVVLVGTHEAPTRIVL